MVDAVTAMSTVPRRNGHELGGSVFQGVEFDGAANGTRMRICAAHFPSIKTIEDFSFDQSAVNMGTVWDLTPSATTTRASFCSQRGRWGCWILCVSRAA
jgi:hypothetical protein